MSASDYEFEEMDSAFLQEVDQIAESQLQTAGGSSSTSASRTSKVAQTSDTIEVLSDDDEVTMLPPPRTTASKVTFRPAKFATTTKPAAPSLPSTSATLKPSSSTAPASKMGSTADMSIDFDDDWDENDLAELDKLESNALRAPPLTRQTTLTGEVLPAQSQAGPSRSTSGHPFGKKAAKTKHWDRTAFSATGKRKGAGKGKRKSFGGDEDENEEEEVDFEQFPAPFVPLGPAPPMKLQADPEAAQEWVYPLNHPKRDYQYNIVRNSLFENSLVALPTGLGKTFIAGVIMLNYYRWFPEGKVVFVAPTKPLVAQQIEACHHTCGIQRSDTVELTGQIPSSKREVHWRNKRVFFMTPQTLVNDLKTGICNVMELVLLVVDEAHKATGGYAYSEVVRYLMAKNPHFRVLALSATPGGKPEAVQAVVDSLHISHIEIRNEDSLDLRQYIHKKEITHTVVAMTGTIVKIRALLAAAMEPLADKLGKAGIVSIQDVVRLHPYRCQAVMGDLSRGGGPRQPWAFGVLQKLGKMARAMGYLIEQSVGMCYKSLTGSLDVDEEEDLPKKKSAQKGRNPTKIDGDPAIKKVIAEIDAQRRTRNNNFPNHPKLDRLLQIALNHFKSTADAEATRVMVFCTFRDCVDEIVGVLNGHGPVLRAARFVGQGADSSGRKGLAQKDQIELVSQFKEGVYNILVATSIGEEGLDIGEVDLIVCYDSQKTPIRMLQRIGRTGRKRNGRIEVLSAAGREEFNYQKAGDSYKDVQDAIVRGEDLELFADVERLLPDEYKPQCVEKVMQIEEFVREEPEEAGSGKGRKRKSGAGVDDDGVKKRKRKSAGGSLAMDIPEGAAKGFVPVNELIARGAKAKGKAAKTTPPKSRLDEYDPDMIAPEDDDEDDLPDLPVPKSWTQSAASPPSKASSSKLVGFASAKSLIDKGLDSDEDLEDLPPLKKTKSKSSATGAGAKPASTGKAAATPKVDKGKGKAKAGPPLSELNTTKPSSSSKGQAKAPPKRSASPIVIPSSPEQAAPQPAKPRRPLVKNPSKTAVLTASKPPAEASGSTDKSMSWLLSDDEDDAPRRPIAKPGAPRIKPSRPNPPSPTIPTKPKPPHSLGLSRAAGPGTFKVPFAVPRRTPLTMPSGAPVGSSSTKFGDLEGLDDPPFEIDIPEIPKAVDDDDSMEVDDEEPPAEDLDVDSSFGVRAPGLKRTRAPQQTVQELSSPDVSMSFPVRGPRAGGRLRRGPPRVVPDSDDHDESAVEQPCSPGHITILDTSIESPAAAPGAPAPRRRSRQKQNQIRSRIGHAMFDMEAGHSGEEVSEGDTCSEGEYETSFVTYGAATQAPEGYDQAAMYRRSLMTQAGPDGPVFAKRPVRYGQYTGGNAGRRGGGGVSDMSSEVGEYELGSFVVEDDDEMMDVSMDSER